MNVSTNEIVVVTGGAGALAGAVAGVFREAGARLVLVDPAAAVHERAAALGATSVVADLTTLAGAGRMVEATLAAHGRLDVVIHTAGAFAMEPAEAADEAAYGRMLDVNLKTLFCVARAVLPVMLDLGHGFLAGISSQAAWAGGGGAGMALYAAAKAAVAAYLRALAVEVGKRGVAVAVVYPLAAIDTPANRRAMPDADPRDWVDPEEIGRALLFAATRPARGRLVELPIAAGR
jgi:NAD(P)-dependent dehydrogenase (short-subunit alcohol dehydrogenase family)